MMKKRILAIALTLFLSLSSMSYVNAQTNSPNSNQVNFLTDCSNDWGFQELQNYSNGDDLAKLYLRIREAYLTALYSTKTYKADSNFDGNYPLAEINCSDLNIKSSDLMLTNMRVLEDHPLFYFWKSKLYYMSKSNNTSKPVSVILLIDKSFASGTTRQRYTTKIVSAIQSFDSLVEGISGNYNIAKTVHDEICRVTDYAYEQDGKTPRNDVFVHNITGYVKNQELVCDGYSRTFSAVMNYLDIFTLSTSGWSVADGERTGDDLGHAWNVIQLDDGQYYFADLTWDDQENKIYYDWFCKGYSFYEDHSVTRNHESSLTWYQIKLPDISQKDFTKPTKVTLTTSDPTYKFRPIDDSNHPHGSLSIKEMKATLYGHDNVKLSWSKVRGATKYKIYYRKSTSKTYKYLTSTTKTSYQKANLADGTKYYFKIVAYNTKDCTNCHGNAKTDSIYTLKKVSTPKMSKASSSKVKVRWTNISGESGYQISQSTRKSKTKIVTTYGTTSGSSKTLKAKKKTTYYYKVRAYRKVDGKRIYGPWSTTIAYKLK